MSERIKYHLECLRDNKELIICFLGFAMAFVVYIDFKEFIKKSQEIQLEQTVALKEVTLRLTNLENKIK